MNRGEDAKMGICPYPYHYFEISATGDVWPCCPAFCNWYSIGNLHKQTLDEIWHGQRADLFRNNLEKGNYSLCNLRTCTVADSLSPDQIKQSYYKDDILKFPETIVVSYDRECNLACRICRKELFQNNDAEEKRCLEIERNFFPYLDNCKKLYMSGLGDPFGSRYARGLIRRTVEKWPHIIFDFITNGLLLNPAMYRELGLKNKVDGLRVSIHAASEEGYKRVTKLGNYQKLLDNLDFFAELKKKRRNQRSCVQFCGL